MEKQQLYKINKKIFEMSGCSFLSGDLLMCRYIGLVIVVLLVSGCPGSKPPETVQEAADQVIRPLIKRHELVGAVVGVQQGGVTRVFSYGETILGSGKSPDADTFFEIGSITKTFTGILLATLALEGLVGLEDPLRTLLPDTVSVPAFEGQEIKLVHLATHTSGLPRLPDNMTPADPNNPYADYTEQQLFGFLSDYVLPRAPGSKYEYSNLGAGLLGYALALRAGGTYEEVLRDHVLKPLGLDDTAVSLSAGQQSQFAQGYAPRHIGPVTLKPVAIPHWEIPVLTAAGGLRSTMNDMLRFLAANLDPEQTPLADALTDAQIPRNQIDATGSIGLGWHIFTDASLAGPMVWHNGGTGGFHSFIGFIRASQVGVVILANTSSDTVDLAGNAILKAALTLPLT